MAKNNKTNKVQNLVQDTVNNATSQLATNAKNPASNQTGLASTANSIGGETPYSWTNLTNVPTYNPTLLNNTQTYNPQYLKQTEEYKPKLLEQTEEYKPNAHYEAVGMPNYKQYASVGDYTWQNWNPYLREETKVNGRGLTNLDENMLKAIQGYWDNGTTDALNSARQNTLDAMNRAYDDNERNYYQTYMRNQNRLPEQLSRNGITGGASESAQLGLLNNYSGNLYNNASQRAQNTSNLNAQYDQILANNSKELANLLIDNYVNTYRTNMGNIREDRNYNTDVKNQAGQYNNQGRNETRRMNLDKNQRLADQNINQYNQGLDAYLSRLQDVLNGNVDIDNNAGLVNYNSRREDSRYNNELENNALYNNWNARRDDSRYNNELANNAIYNNWNATREDNRYNNELVNNAGLANWNQINHVLEYNNQGQNQTNQMNTQYNISEMQTIRAREWETMDREQAHEWEQAGIKDERMYNMALYMLENGGNASMVKKMLGLTDKQGKNLEKAWKKAQKSNSSSGGGSGGSGWGYYRSSGGGTTTSGIDMSGYGQDNGNSENNSGNNTGGNKTESKKTPIPPKNSATYYNQYASKIRTTRTEKGLKKLEREVGQYATDKKLNQKQYYDLVALIRSERQKNGTNGRGDTGTGTTTSVNKTNRRATQ